MVDGHACDKRRDALLVAANRLFERHGFRRTSIEDIAREAGVGKGTVYLHFATKEELGIAWLDAMHQKKFAKMRKAAEAEAEPTRRVVAYLAERVAVRYASISRYKESANEMLESICGLLVSRREEYQREEADYLAGILADGVAAGVFDLADPSETAKCLLLATNGLMPSAQFGREMQYAAEMKTNAVVIGQMLVESIRRKEKS